MKKSLLMLMLASLTVNIGLSTVLAEEDSGGETPDVVENQPAESGSDSITPSDPAQESSDETQNSTSETTQATTTEEESTTVNQETKEETEEETKEETEEENEDDEEQKKLDAERKRAQEAAAARQRQLLLNQRRPSYNPADYTPAAPVSTPEITEDSDSPEEKEEKPGLLDGDYVIFNASIFETEEEADVYIKMIEEDEDNEDRFIIEKESLEDGLILVTVEYKEDAEEEGQPILFYVASAFETEVEAVEYAEKNLLMYPDIFFDAEIIEAEEKFDAIFGIRSNIDTQALTYDEESYFILYLEDRQEFSYIITADEAGNFNDKIPMVVESVFPGEFTFTEEDISETEKRVTMTPVETEAIEEVEETGESEDVSEE